MKTCWNSMRPFREVGAVLKAAYNSAAHLAKKYNTKLKRRGKRAKKSAIKRSELVYLEKSPNYCNYDPVLGKVQEDRKFTCVMFLVL